MSARLRALNASSSSSNGQDPFAAQPLGERAVASAALAAFLGYLTFTKCSTNTSTPEVLPSGSTGRSGPGGGLPSGHAVDVLCALRSAEEDGTMLRTLPWVTRYLRFLKKDPHAARAPYFRETLELLARLRSLPQLTPGHPSFSLGALCLRSLLEDFAANVPLPSRDRQKRLPETSTQMYRDRDAMHASSEQESGANGGAVAGGMILAAGDAWVDARYIELTCPVLTQARSLFSSAALPGLGVDGVESAAGAAGMRPRPGPPKKIRPTAPLSTAAAPQLPANVTAAHAAARDAVKLRLQRAFLEQYSGEEHRVKLKDVVEYASDVIAATAAASAVHAVMPSAIEAAAAQLHEAVAQHAASLTGPEAPGAQLAQGQRPLIMKSSTSSDAAITQFALAAAEGAITATTERVAAAAYDHAVEEIRLRAAHAMLGLTAPELGEAVVSTAAAIVAEAAQTACGERLIGLAQSQVREALTRQAQSAAKAVLKATSRKSGAGDGGTAPGLSAPVL